MDEHNDEEHGVEVRDYGRGADDGAPGEALDPVGDVVGLAAVRPETAGEELVSEEEVSRRRADSR